MSHSRAALLLSLATLVASAASASEPIEKNPFTRPGYTADRPLPGPLQEQPEVLVPLRLKATLIAGPRALANVSGEILAPGDEIQGHRLVRVTEGRAVLIKEGRTVTLSVHDDSEEDTRD